MRQLLGTKKVKRLAAETGLPIVKVMVRGGTDHRKDLCLEDGSIVSLYRDGTMENDPTCRWRVADQTSSALHKDG